MFLEVEIALCRWQDALSWAAGGAVRSSSQCLIVSSPSSQHGARIIKYLFSTPLPPISPDLIAEMVGKGKHSQMPQIIPGLMLCSLYLIVGQPLPSLPIRGYS